MTWLAFVAGAVLSWGVYGAMLHQGQVRLGSPMRALLCVGVAYFLVGVVVPVITLFAQGQGLRGFTAAGTTRGDRRRHARRARRRLHHLLVPHRRHAHLRDAAGLRRRPARQRALHDGDAPAQDRARARCCTSASWSPRSARAWCCISSLRRENGATCTRAGCHVCHVPRAASSCQVRATCGATCDVRSATCGRTAIDSTCRLARTLRPTVRIRTSHVHAARARCIVHGTSHVARESSHEHVARGDSTVADSRVRRPYASFSASLMRTPRPAGTGCAHTGDSAMV